MGKYDIDAKLTSECKLTLSELISEIDTEYYIDCSIETLKSKFKNNKKSGLIDKLNKLLNFDIEEISNKSSSEKFDALKLLKELFLIEKYGSPKYERNFNPRANIRIHIIDILAKPRLSNIKSYYTSGSKYGNVFETLFSDIKMNVLDSDECIQIIDGIDDFWQYLAQRQFDYVLSNMALADKDSSIMELKRINCALERIVENIDYNNRNSKMCADGVMKSFFTLLLTHKKLCYELDRMKANEYVDIDIRPDKEYTELFRNNEDIWIDISDDGMLKDSDIWLVVADASTSKDTDILFDENEFMEKVFYLITYGQGITQEEKKHYKYALNHFQKVLSWVMKEKNDADFSNKVPLVLFVSIMQEIVYVKKNSKTLSVRIDYYGYNATSNSLMSALKKPEDEIAPILVDIWTRRIDTRFAINYGAHDLIVEKNKAELMLFRIKQFMYGYKNMSELRDAHYFIAHKVAIIHTNSSITAEKESLFRVVLNEKLSYYGMKVKKFVLPDDPQIIYDMFRELLSLYGLNRNDYIDIIAEQVAKLIIKQNKLNSDSCIIKYTFNICDQNGHNGSCILDFKYEKNSNCFYYINSGFIYSEHDKEIIKKLGLQKVV